MVSVVCTIFIRTQFANEIMWLTFFLAVLVVVSAGNDGEMGAFTTGIPGNVVSAFSVASVNNEYISYDGSLTATGMKDPIGKIYQWCLYF